MGRTRSGRGIWGRPVVGRKDWVVSSVGMGMGMVIQKRAVMN